jgi:TPP-dependent pyruvate/acetoin dehydrogenase alpha subunit
LIVLENNHIAQTTPAELAIAGSISQRFEAFGIPAARIDSSDILKISPLAEDLIGRVRDESTPHALIIDTARLGTHSKGDDTRPQEIVEKLWRERDPLAIHSARLSEGVRSNITLKIETYIQAAFTRALGRED